MSSSHASSTAISSDQLWACTGGFFLSLFFFWTTSTACLLRLFIWSCSQPALQWEVKRSSNVMSCEMKNEPPQNQYSRFFLDFRWFTVTSLTTSLIKHELPVFKTAFVNRCARVWCQPPAWQWPVHALLFRMHLNIVPKIERNKTSNSLVLSRLLWPLGFSTQFLKKRSGVFLMNILKTKSVFSYKHVSVNGGKKSKRWKTQKKWKSKPKI